MWCSEMFPGAVATSIGRVCIVADSTSPPSCQGRKPTAGREGGGRLRPADRLGLFASWTARLQHLSVNEPAVVVFTICHPISSFGGRTAIDVQKAGLESTGLA